ncbi:P-loop NTPase fold protein [Methanobrevibacter woesei]
MDKKDVAIKHKRDDLLNRKKLARKISDYILSYKDIEPLTIGIIGKWGSGKSSLINLILCYLEFEIKNNPLDKDYIIIHFNPWFFSNQENLYLQFFKLIIEKITTHGYEKYSLFERATTHRRSIFKKLKIETLDEYVNFLQSNQTVPDNIMTYGLNSNQIESYYSLLAHKEFCDEYFEDSKYKIIVIIDDIDRLNDKEIKKVITLVKSLADFKNFIYILSFDKDIVAKSLATLQSDKGDKFLDKIVQIPINVPEVNQSRMDRIIFNELSEIYNSRLNNFINKDKDLMEILPYLTVFIKDLRDLKRYKNMLNFYINNFDDELNIDDFFVLLALQVFESKIFSILPKYKDILTTHR